MRKAQYQRDKRFAERRAMLPPDMRCPVCLQVKPKMNTWIIKKVSAKSFIAAFLRKYIRNGHVVLCIKCNFAVMRAIKEEENLLKTEEEKMQEATPEQREIYKRVKDMIRELRGRRILDQIREFGQAFGASGYERIGFVDVVRPRVKPFIRNSSNSGDY